MDYNCKNKKCDVKIITNIIKPKLLCPVCHDFCILDFEKAELEEDPILKNLPWACCGAKIPAGERCPVCGDRE